jgi:hypothetical protein
MLPVFALLSTITTLGHVLELIFKNGSNIERSVVFIFSTLLGLVFLVVTWYSPKVGNIFLMSLFVGTSMVYFAYSFEILPEKDSISVDELVPILENFNRKKVGYSKLYLMVNITSIVWLSSWWIPYIVMSVIYFATSFVNNMASKNQFDYSTNIVDDLYYVMLILCIVYFERKFFTESFKH